MKKQIFILLCFGILINLNFVLALNETIDRNYAMNEINNSQGIISEFIVNNFSTQYLEDTLFEAQTIFKQVDYAEILRGNINASASDIKEATLALQLIKWKNLSYADVVASTDKIRERRVQAFLLYDKLVIAKQKGNTSEALTILTNAETSFYNGRYNETDSYLQDFANYLEAQRIEQSTINVFSRNTKNFFQKYWIEIIGVLLALVVIIYILEKIRMKKNLRSKIEKMKAEKESLDKLIKKAQRDRFEKNKISGLVYNIQMEKYNERLQAINDELPVLTKELKNGKKIKKRK